MSEGWSVVEQIQWLTMTLEGEIGILKQRWAVYAYQIIRHQLLQKAGRDPDASELKCDCELFAIIEKRLNEKEADLEAIHALRQQILENPELEEELANKLFKGLRYASALKIDPALQN